MKKFQKKKRMTIFDIINTLLVVLITCVVAYPLYFVVIASLSDPIQVAAGNTLAWIKGFTLDAYKLIIQEKQLWVGYRNTIIYTVLGTLYRLALTIPAAYVMSKEKLPFRGVLSWFFFITMYIGGGMIPEFLLMRDLHLLDNPLVMIIGTAGVSCYNMIVTRQYFSSNIHSSLYEAAYMDGASEWRTFTSIALPLAKPIIAVMALYIGVGIWNTYYKALLYIYGDPKDSWLFKYIEEVLNIKLDITTYTADNKSEFLSLAFASNELPDIIIGANFSTAELLNYGEVEGQLLDLAPYVNQTYMPNLYSIYQDRPELKSYVTTAAGNIWSLGRISSGSVRGGSSRWFMNYDWLEQCNLEVPTTLDEFIDVMRTFKQKGLCKYPIGGGYASEHPGAYILNAMGYVGANSKAYGICLRNGKVVMPLADREAFGDYLKVMNQLYTEGLIHPDFFTMDRNSIYAVFAEKVGFIMQAPFVATEDYSEYWSALPLTSQWNDTAVVPGSAAATYGGVIVSADTENPELCAKFIDAFYAPEENNLFRKSMSGPAADETDILYGLSGWTMTDGVLSYADYDNCNGKYASTSEYTAKTIQLWVSGAFGYASWECGDNNPYFEGEPDASKYEDPSVLRKDPIISGNGDKHYEYAQQTVLTPYVTTETYPSAVYMDADKATELAQTLSALRAYAKSEIAKFITGARPLTDAELDDYFTQLEALGSKEYVQAYQDYYDSLKK